MTTDWTRYRHIRGASTLTDKRLRRIVNVVERRQRGLMLIMEDVHNPHNLAAIARSCDAFGVQEVAFTLENADLFDPTQRGKVASASAAKWLDYRIFDAGTDDALTTLKAEGWTIIASVLRQESQPIHEMDFTQYDKLALMVGNEHAGLSETAQRHADAFMKIPMQGMIQSFNVSVAAALSLFEITRQRRASPRDFSLPDADADALVEDFIRRALR